MPRPLMLRKTIYVFAICFLMIAIQAFDLHAIDFIDDLGNRVQLDRPPERVVSLVPSMTEIIFAIGAGDRVVAVSHVDTWPPAAAQKPVVGGFFAPDVETVAAFQPEIIFISNLHTAVIEHFKGTRVKLICLQTQSIQDSFKIIERLGDIFGRQSAAGELVAGIRNELALIEQKVAKIPKEDRQRVIRLMGHDRVMAPGDDSFQNEMIRAAGGIPPQLGKTGSVVAVSLSEWQAFNPQVIYGCGGDKRTALALFDKPGWREVDAVKTGRIFYFPCDLTCRAATKTGYFAGWLAARIYADCFAVTQNQVHPDGIFKSRPIAIDLPYVRKARVAYSRIHDFINKTLLIDFKQPQQVVSTLEGRRDSVRTIGNHFSPPAGWAVAHNAGLEQIRTGIHAALGVSNDTAALLITGADMDNLVVKREAYKEMEIFALVTAGVRSNALRMSRDTGGYYEPGTINVLILPSMQLSERAMTRAIISATEGKTAALLDMDIRSSYNPRDYRATGTGTDNIIVAAGSGNGPMLDNAGGHSKLGELVARAVYAGVREAVFRQNGLTAERNIFQRLRERHITPHSLVAQTDCECGRPKNRISSLLERTLLNPRYSAFVETALALSDDYEKGLLKDLSLYKQWCQGTAEEIAGRRIDRMRAYPETNGVPVVLKLALDALLNGVYNQNTTAKEG